MILFNVNFDTFKNIIAMETTGLIFLTIERFPQEETEVPSIVALYTLYTYAGRGLIKTTQSFYDVKEAIMFEETYLNKDKVVPVLNVEEEDFKLNIVKG